ncbi:type IX secretion system membrane protein PorP/SprF [Altibacter sp.]|uniref:PorP/SprF family type IX secretion system membrane protein n=1 Tax=Altibacter sp. TaxID=2024823 RepID=UPI0025826C71|nr:type IX secretion system membrane protein PorP/SprF [Altibacter sp.]MCW8981225.1 type IX secretion system membrane protein PorP/SprF [Altibacter sp.]MCW9037752.1 type IX secretion system membrane protein PorP/SprF [Altibacter sp.]
MNIKTTYLLLLLIIAPFVYAQDGIPVYSNYFADNYYLLHPSMAGAANYSKLRITARQQWFDQDEAPNIQTVTFNTRLNDRSGVGAILFNDRNGYHSQAGAYLTYAHHISFSRGSDVDLNQLSLGLSGGFIQSKLDETQFDPNDFDPIIAGIIQSTSYYNIDAGASYNFLNFSGHFTIKNLIFKNRGLNDEGFESNNQRRYMIAGSYNISKYGSYWMFEPSFLFQFQERTGEQAIDINFKAYRELEEGRIWGGLSYRRSFDGSEYLDGTEIKDQKLQYFTPVLGVNYKKFVFAYMYSYQTGTVRFRSGGFHQITLGYNFVEGKIRRWSQDMRYNGMLRPNN